MRARGGKKETDRVCVSKMAFEHLAERVKGKFKIIHSGVKKSVDKDKTEKQSRADKILIYETETDKHK